jgi:hypothetical protein
MTNLLYVFANLSIALLALAWCMRLLIAALGYAQPAVTFGSARNDIIFESALLFLLLWMIFQ